MPRNVRNFWIDAQVDGRSNDVGTGPIRRDGGLCVQVYIRDTGAVALAADIEAIARRDGTLLLRIEPAAGMKTTPSGRGFQIVTAR